MDRNKAIEFPQSRSYVVPWFPMQSTALCLGAQATLLVYCPHTSVMNKWHDAEVESPHRMSILSCSKSAVTQYHVSSAVPCRPLLDDLS